MTSPDNFVAGDDLQCQGYTLQNLDFRLIKDYEESNKHADEEQSPVSCYSPLVSSSPRTIKTTDHLNAKIVESLQEGVAVFCTATRGVYSVYNLIKSNSAFISLFEINTVNMNLTFSQRIFKSYNSPSQKHTCFFQLIEQFIVS